jgi:hypothetical protein
MILKYILIFILLIVPVQAVEKLTFSYSDLITATDSLAIRTDTVYSPWKQADVGRFFNYAFSMAGGGKDTNWLNDTFNVSLQTSFDQGSLIKTTSLFNFLSDSTIIPDTTYDIASKVMLPWIRFRVIHRDSIGVGEADSALVHNPNPYTKIFSVWYLWR